MLYCVYRYIYRNFNYCRSQPKMAHSQWVKRLLGFNFTMWKKNFHLPFPEWHLTSSCVYYQWFIPSTTIKSRCYIFAVTFSFFPEWTEERFRKWVYPFVEYCGFVESTKSTKINAELFYSLQITRSKTLCRDWKIPTFVPSCCCCFLSD